jgi:dimethylhistidine N-methyltransferase
MAVAPLLDLAPRPSSVRAEVLEGLAGEPKTLPCKLFYDAAGARLFERICALDEYYLTRTELAILRRHGGQMAEHIGPRARIVEPGSGAGLKTRILLDSLVDPVTYVPVDISREQLEATARELAAVFPDLWVQPVCADYTGAVRLPDPPGVLAGTSLFYPGSTIGNFEPAEARAFLLRVHALVGVGGGALIGVDLLKDPAVLIPAYDDAEGVTALFNKNLLVRLNRELGADFDVSQFTHRARYEPRPSRIVMELVSTRDQTVRVAGQEIAFMAGEPIRTEYSHKPSRAEFAALARAAGFAVEAVWTDDEGLFSVQMLRALPNGPTARTPARQSESPA